MPFNGSGTFSIVNQFVANTTILSAAVNQNFSDIATGLSDCLTRDGQAGMTADFKAISGSLGSPGITFNSDATAGLYLSTTGIMGLVAKSLGLLVNSSIYCVTAAAVQAGGSGYAVGDTITLTGGTAITQAVLTVATLSGTAVATVTVTYGGFYSTKPADPVGQGSSSGAGTGATFNMTWAAQYANSIVTSEAGAVPWQRLGSSSFVSGLMAKANGLDLATAIGSSNIAAVLGSTFIIPPGGILTPVSSTTSPVPATDSTAVTRIYWTPINANNCPIYNGTNIIQANPGQLFCDLTAGSQATGAIQDIYMFLNAGVPTLGFSPSWSAGTGGSVTAGSCARGTGAGGTAFTVINGLKVNAVTMTVNNGATTYTMPANQGTLLGSIYVNSTAGQINCHRSTGQSRIWGLSNIYNARTVYLNVADNTVNWTNTPTTWRQSRADSTNFAIAFNSVASEEVEAQFTQNITQAYSSSTSQANIGIGINATNAATGMVGWATALNSTTVGGNGSSMKATTVLAPTIGINQFNCVEQAPSGTTNNTFLGTSANMLMSLTWRA